MKHFNQIGNDLRRNHVLRAYTHDMGYHFYTCLAMIECLVNHQILTLRIVFFKQRVTLLTNIFVFPKPFF